MPYPNIQQLHKEFLQGVVEQFPVDPEQFPFEIFPEILKEGDEWTTDVKQSAVGRAQVSPVDTEPSSVQPRPVGKLTIMPERSAEDYWFNQSERRKLRRPGSETRAKTSEIIADAGALLLQRRLVWKNLRWAQVLTGRTFTVTDENGMTYTVSYANLIGTMNNPTTLVGGGGLAWSNTAATIVQDIANYKRTFKAANGVRPNTVWCNSDIEQHLLKNTEFVDWVKSSMRMTVQEFLSEKASTPGRLGWNFMGLDWKFVDAMYHATDNDPTSLTAYWGADVLTFAREVQGERVLEYWKEDTDETNRTGGPTLEVREKPGVKGRYGVTLYSNGLSVVKMPNRISIVADIDA